MSTIDGIRHQNSLWTLSSLTTREELNQSFPSAEAERAGGSNSKYILVIILLACSLTVQSQDDHLYRILKHKNAVQSLAFSPDSKTLATGGEDQMIYLWDIATGETILSLTCQSKPVRYLSFSPDGSLILSAAGTSITLWNLSGQPVRNFPGNVTHVWNVIFSPDGSRIYSTSLQEKFSMWDTETAEKVAAFEGHTRTVLAVDASSDGSLLASGSLDQNIIIWDAVTKTPLRTINAHAGNIYSVCFSPDNRFLVSASLDETAKIWDVATGRIVHLLAGHEYSVMQARYSPDGSYIITASYDRTARLWEAATGKSLYTFSDHSDVVNATEFSPDGNFIATASNDGAVLIWKMGPRYIAEHYYWNEIQEEFGQAAILREKDKSESKTDYNLRLEQAEEYRQGIYQKYFLMHQSVHDTIKREL
jgi:WD40 repeat protein